MVQLPTADNSLRRRLPQAGIAVVPVADGSAIAAGAQNLGQGVAALGQGLQRKALYDESQARVETTKTDAIAEADRLNQYNAQIGAFEDTLKTDTDYGTQAKRFDETQAKVKDTLLAGITNPLEREQARVKIDALGLSYKNRVEAGMQAGQRDVARAGVNKIANDALEVAAKPGVDPVVHDQTLIATQNALKAARDNGVISAQEYEAQTQEFTGRYRERRFEQKMDGKRTELLTGKPPVVGGPAVDGDAGGTIDPQARQVLTSVLAKDKDASHIDGLKPRFANNLASLFESAPPEIRSGLGILSGERSVARQQQLWNASDKTGRTVARPGGSEHNQGNAVDLSFNGQKLEKAPQSVRDWVRDNAPKHGLGLPMDYEPWHVEDFEARPADSAFGSKVREAVAGARPDLMAGALINRAKEFPAISPQEFFGAGVDVASLPAGLRNNNPGNIKYVRGSALPGITGPSQNTDQGDPQAVFSSPQAGATAAAQLALRKFDGGKTTVRQIIAAKGGWTPGNDTAAQNIAKYAGLDPDQPLDLRKNPKQLTGLMRGIFMQEQGDAHSKYDDGLLASAASAALGGEPVRFSSSGSSAPASRPWTPKDDPDYLSLPYTARERVDRQWEQDTREIGMQKRVGIETAIDNAPDAIQQTGAYTGVLPTRQDFATAYGLEEGERKADAFEAAVDTAQTVHGMQVMPNAEIQQTLEAARPKSTGDGAALEGKRYSTLQTAATAVLAARQKDPAAYVMQAMPNVRAAWEGVTPGSAEYANAIRMTTDAQRSLGIPSASIQPLPDTAAKSVVDLVKDATVPATDRLQAITSSVFATKDPEQQQAIFRQMVKQGAPAELAGVMAATARGDQASASWLFQAAVSDPEKLPGGRAVKEQELNAEIQTQLMADGQLGDAVYGLSNGGADAMELARRDAPLIKKSVELYVRDGRSLSDAVTATARNMWGDVKVFRGGYGIAAEAVVPSDVDAFTLSKGLERATADVFRQAIEKTIERRLSGDQKIASDPGTQSVAKQIMARALPAYLDASSFRTYSPGHLGLVNETTGEFAHGDDGKPITMAVDDILKMGRDTSATRAAAPRGAGAFATPRAGVR